MINQFLDSMRRITFYVDEDFGCLTLLFQKESKLDEVGKSFHNTDTGRVFLCSQDYLKFKGIEKGDSTGLKKFYGSRIVQISNIDLRNFLN